MNDIFNPSLIISLGLSAKKALTLSEKFLSCLPQYLKNVIRFYDIEEFTKAGDELQEIIDNRLLSAKYLNILVDMGYKVRTLTTAPVKLNIYLLWDVYNSPISGYEIIKVLTALNYGNVDKELHTGATILIIPILDREWRFKDKAALEAISQLKETIAHMSQQETLLAIDSKVYMLHSVSGDGSRILIEELEYICAILIYLTVVPSGDPPLMHYNRKLIKEEGKYKIGTVGINSLAFLKDKLIDNLAENLAMDILDFACKSSSEGISIFAKVSELLSYGNQLRNLRYIVGTPQEQEEIIRYNEAVSETIGRELNKIILESGFAAGVKFLEELTRNIENQRSCETHTSEEEKIKEAIVENNKEITRVLYNLKKDVEAVSRELLKVLKERDEYRNGERDSCSLVASLADSVDCTCLYKGQYPDIGQLYLEMMIDIGDYRKFKEQGTYDEILRNAKLKVAAMISMDIQELLTSAYGDDKEKEISRWIRGGLVKSQYLLQFTNSEKLEEHLLLLTCPELASIVQSIIAKEFNNLNTSSINSTNSYINCISIIKLCFGIDFEKIAPVKNLKMLAARMQIEDGNKGLVSR
ncbi:MAG: hypothetical protein Q8930_07470 [Bacillota bacterium]|nr:hypothetical protein [Bacillota bacterium]